MPSPTPESIASTLLSIGAVSFNPQQPYSWASGLKSPVYCDNRLLLGYPEERKQVIKGFQNLLAEQDITADIIAGTATAGIPHAAWLAHEVNLPMVYVRSKPKEHGRRNQIEGPIEAGKSAIIIEDLISTGKSSIAAVRALVEAGVKVKAVLAIFSYGFDQAAETFTSAGVPYFVLTSFDTLINVAVQEDRLEPGELNTLRTWQTDPHAWSSAFNEE